MRGQLRHLRNNRELIKTISQMVLLLEFQFLHHSNFEKRQIPNCAGKKLWKGPDRSRQYISSFKYHHYTSQKSLEKDGDKFSNADFHGWAGPAKVILKEKEWMCSLQHSTKLESRTLFGLPGSIFILIFYKWWRNFGTALERSIEVRYLMNN